MRRGPCRCLCWTAWSSSGDQCLLVRGNADRGLVAISDGVWCEHPESRSAAEQLRSDQLRLLAELPHPLFLDVDGFGSVVFCHGTPRDDEEVVLVDTRLDKWAEVFADLDADVRTVVCGHTHMPFVRLVGRVGSSSIRAALGCCTADPGGAWALLHDGQVSLRHTSVDLDVAIAAVIAGSSYWSGRRGPRSIYVQSTATPMLSAPSDLETAVLTDHAATRRRASVAESSDAPCAAPEGGGRRKSRQ